VRYGERIPDVAWNVQQNVKNALEGVMDIAIENINIHVQGVRRDDGEDERPAAGDGGDA
jgi:uncharacterized alkaline shock family protein YloU